MVKIVVDELTDRAPRVDPSLPGTGGPAGNARLTAWTGLVLLVLLGVEGATLLDVRGLISWHIGVGLLLIPPAVVKVGSTGWRIMRYYSGNPAYRTAGPPQPVMRVLGPLVVLATLLVLGTGMWVAVVGPGLRDQRILGLPVTALFLHQASFVAWLVVMTAHVLGRTVRAVNTVTRRAGCRSHVAGGRGRAVVLTAMVVSSVVLAVLLPRPWISTWQHTGFPPHYGHGDASTAIRAR